MTLQQLDRNVSMLYGVWRQDDNDCDWRPGDLCSHWQDRSCFGFVIAVTEENVLVLWSKEPFSTVSTTFNYVEVSWVANK